MDSRPDLAASLILLRDRLAATATLLREFDHQAGPTSVSSPVPRERSIPRWDEAERFEQADRYRLVTDEGSASA